ncbi:beta-tubulin folding cofactor D [Encephalitozoon romaleae SJ-2008]|uniref:Beta-tubulin folding cofactor D n=1 Tax=Encephalitozoon romaleae (strain SJ-2008) TaxID=1178016 RepID=I6ZIQ6_ENCRO|nr:beta-tubulin folding cofactor D [Encephalitozoon romaleae SJ-2008]AFN83108.1 beta-tubulin folding cofactor D [Encephalitozoon romaleae SJ-2008]
MPNLNELIQLMERANELIRDHRKNPDSAFPTDIKYLKPIMGSIDILKSKNSQAITLWLELLLRNPFPLKIDEESLSKMVSFFLEATKTTETRKPAFKCLAMLAQRANVMHCSTEEPSFYIHNIEVSELTYYEFLAKLSSFGKKVQLAPVEDHDSVMIKKMKMKIMSNNPTDNVLKCFFEMLNERDSRLGWTLCKSFLKVIKYVETGSVVSALKERCSVIFANENTWINAMTILGMMSLQGWDIGDVSDIVLKGISYTNEMVSNSETVRESALFLLWALTRKSNAVGKDLLCLVVGRALFDPSLSCRRGASAVVLEHIGRFPEAGKEEIVSLINFHSVKRLRNCSKAVKRVLEILKCEEVFEEILLKNLLHCNLETKRQSGYCISRHFRGDKVVEYISSINPKTPSDFISILIVIQEFTEQSREHEIEKIVETIAKLKVDPSFCKYKDFDIFVENYLRVIEDLRALESRDIICGNLYMFLIKNVLPSEVSRVSWRFISEDEGFASKVAQSFRRGTEGLILANARNSRYKEKLGKGYLELLEHGNIDTKAYAMKAIRLSGDIEKYKDHILGGLENYHTDFRGDVSFRLRRESLMASFLMEDRTISSRYFIRYFVDKSKILRDECILLCKNNGIIPEGFEYIGRKGYSVDSDKFQLVIEFLDSFYIEFKRLENESSLGNDKMLFMASFEASKCLGMEYQEEFFRGVLGTIGSSDASLRSFIIEEVFKARERFEKLIITMFYKSCKRVMYPAIEVVCEMIRLETEEDCLVIFGNNHEILNRLSLILQESSVPDGIGLTIRNALERNTHFSES